MNNFCKIGCLAISTVAMSFVPSSTLAQDALQTADPQQVVTVQKTEAAQASTEALLQHLLIMTNAQTRNAASRIGNEKTPLSRASKKPIEALTFMQNHVHVKKVNVYSFTGLDLEVVGRVMENGRNKKDRVGTILLAQKNYATGKTGVFTPRRPFAYLNLDQVDSLVIVLNEIVKESYNWQQYPTEITYVADGGLMVQYYGVQQKVFFKNVAPSDRIDSFDYSTYSKSSFYGYSIEVKVQKELPQIVDALQRAKREVEDYLNFR